MFILFTGYNTNTNPIYAGANVTNVTSRQLAVCTCPSDIIAVTKGQTYSKVSYHNYAANFGNTAVADASTDGKMSTETTYNGLTFGEVRRSASTAARL